MKEVATPERLAKAGVQGVETILNDPVGIARGSPIGVQRIVAAPLDRMWKAGLLASWEYEAGDKLRKDWHASELAGAIRSVDMDQTIGSAVSHAPSMFVAQYVADARIRIRHVRHDVKGVVWDVLNLAVLLERDLADVGLMVFKVHDPREATVAGKCGLRVALGSLAWHYRMGPN